MKLEIPKEIVAAWFVEKIRYWIEDLGKTHKWVGEQIGCSNQHVSRICKKYGIKTQRTGPRSGAGHPEWKGGRYLCKGYWYIYSPFHPNKTKQGYVAEHRLIMERELGRFLGKKEVVHHKDGNSQNNHPDNLIVFRKNSDHLKHELSQKVPNWSDVGYERMKIAALKKSILGYSKDYDDLPPELRYHHPI